MDKTKSDITPIRELELDELDKVVGGNSISIRTTLPNYTGPKVSAPKGSIAQGDTLDNTLTYDGLP